VPSSPWTTNAREQPEDQIESRVVTDFVVGERTSIFKLFPIKDQPLLDWGNSIPFLDLVFDDLGCVRRFDIEGDGFPRQVLDEDLHRVDFLLILSLGILGGVRRFNLEGDGFPCGCLDGDLH